MCTFTKDLAKNNGLVLLPVIMLFGVLLSGFGLKFYFLLALFCCILVCYKFLLVSFHFPMDYVYPILILLVWACVTFIFFGRGEEKNYHLGILFISFIVVIGMYIYGYHIGVSTFANFLLFYMGFLFVISILEMRFGLVLPMSAKAAENKEYAALFKGIPTGLFYNSNDFATVITLIFVYLFSYFTVLKKNIRWIIFGLSFLLIVFTASRGALLAILFFPIVLKLAMREKIRTVLIVYIGLFAFVGLTVFIMYRFFLSNQVVERFFSRMTRALIVFKGGGDSSFLTRFLIIGYTFQNISSVLIGWGPGGANTFLQGSNPFNIVNPHNFFLEVLINYGLIGITITLLLFFKANKTMKMVRENTKNIKNKASAVGALSSIYLFTFISIISSSILKDWTFGWFPISITLLTYGSFKRETYNNEFVNSTR